MAAEAGVADVADVVAVVDGFLMPPEKNNNII